MCKVSETETDGDARLIEMSGVYWSWATEDLPRAKLMVLHYYDGSSDITKVRMRYWPMGGRKLRTYCRIPDEPAVRMMSVHGRRVGVNG